MALNLGPEAFEAVQRLKQNADWRVFVDALDRQVSATMHNAIDGPFENRVDQTGYARGLRDVVSAILQMENVTRGGQVPRSPVRRKELTDV